MSKQNKLSSKTFPNEPRSTTVKRRRPFQFNGQTVCELPLLLWLTFVGIGLPLCGLVSLAFRSALLTCMVNDCCVHASRAMSFSDAQTTVKQRLSIGCANFSGIQLCDCSVTVVAKRLDNGFEQESSSPISPASIDTESTKYFLKLQVDGKISPLLPPGQNVLQIPGLTCPYGVRISRQLYVENPLGLSS